MSTDFTKKICSTIDISTLADNLCRLMQEAKIDSADLSKKTGIALTTINGLRRGIGNPTLSTLYQLANCFSISIGQLMETSLSISDKKSRLIYEIPLLIFNRLLDFLKDKKQYKNTIVTELDDSTQKQCYAIKLHNNAMSPFFERGSIFVVIHDTCAYDGDIVLVQFDQHPPCFRRVFIQGESYFFKSISELINENIVKSNNFIIHGIVIKAIQHFHN